VAADTYPSLDNGHFNNVDNEIVNKFEKNKKIKK
jgi:hypothetical protein